MYRKYFCTEVIIFLLLSHVGWNGPSTTLLSCSYEDSQIVQLLIEKKVLPILNRYRATLPLDCPFHSKRDIFGWPKRNLFTVTSEPYASSDLDHDGNWLCPMCGQKLSCEENGVVKSMEHIYISSNGDEDAVCLASYCDIMRCEVMSKKLKQEKLKRKSNDITPRTKQQQPKLDIEYKENIEFAKKFANRAPCDPNKMVYLMERCRAVIRQCTMGLLINLSVKDFEDIEDEMNKAICSYLTCEKFWDDNITEVRHVAVYLCLILGVVIVGGFCLCYYIVWILFGALPHEEQQYMQNKPERRADIWCNDIYSNNKNGGSSYLTNGGPHVYQWAPMRTECVNQDQLIFRR